MICILYVFSRCNMWRDRQRVEGVYSDWFDGKRFEEEKEWLSDERNDINIVLLTNVDWWQVFQRTVHSMGAIYASILNLPRELRQQLENIMTLGEPLMILGVMREMIII